MTLSGSEEYLIEERDRLAVIIARQRDNLVAMRATVEQLEDLIHKAAKIANHLPYLCESLPEPSLELEQAASQLQALLVQRRF